MVGILKETLTFIMFAMIIVFSKPQTSICGLNPHHNTRTILNNDVTEEEINLSMWRWCVLRSKASVFFHVHFISFCCTDWVI